MSMGWIRFLLTAVCVLSGLAVCCIGVYGTLKFKYVINRMHAAATLDTLGIALTCIGFAISAPDLFTAMKILLVVVFWWLSSPVASHLLCRLEIITDEQRGEYMVVHKGSMAEEAAQTAKKAEEAAEEQAGEAAEENTENAQDAEEGEAQ